MEKEPFNKEDFALISAPTRQKIKDFFLNLLAAIVLGALVIGGWVWMLNRPAPPPSATPPTPTISADPTLTPTPTEAPAVVPYSAICNDGTGSYSTGRGTCSWHDGVNYYTGY